MTNIIISDIELQKIEGILGYFSKPKTDEEIFYNLCFVLMVPGTKFSTTRSVLIKLKEINFYSEVVSMSNLKKAMKCLRFYNNKAWNVMQAKSQFRSILLCLNSSKSWLDKRNWLVDNVCGLGMKTASHFLRNMGCRDLAVIDTHIIKFMNRHLPKNRKDYLNIEKEFIAISETNNLVPAVLDAYIWKEKSNTDYSVYDY